MARPRTAPPPWETPRVGGHPRLGPAAFYLKGVAPPEIGLHHIYRALWPFMIMQLIAMVLVLFFPQIALWLPGVLLGG